MTICFNLSLVLVSSLVMCLSLEGTASNVEGINCKVNEPFNSAFVTPVIAQNTEVTGCISKDTSTTEQEIHVLSLVRSSLHSLDAGNDYLPSVSLEVLPSWKERPPPTSIVVVLLSHTPVMWQLNLQHMANSTNFRIIVNKPSHVVPTSKVPVSRRKLPPLNRLPSWIKSHYGAVTSFSSVPVANEISLFVGIDTSTSSQGCNFSSPSQSIHVKASFTQLQPATGCSVKGQSSVKRVHGAVFVLELSSNALNGDVLVHLRPAYNRTERNVTLVLKCHVPVMWVVESTGIQGLQHIVSEHPVHIRADPLLTWTKVEERSLPSSTAALLASVQSSFGGFDTYVRTAKANRINVLIDGETKYTIADEEVSSSHSDVIIAVNQKNDSSRTPLKDPAQSAHFLLAKQMSLACSVDRATVSFPLQETMAVFSRVLAPHSKLSFVSLLDPNCKARQNETHIVLRASWHECGTRQVVSGGIHYHNQVQFVTSKYTPSKESTSEPKNVPTDDDDYISEDGSGSEAISSTNVREERVIFPLPFHCTQTGPKRTTDSSGHEYKMSLYSKKDYHPSSLLENFPLNVVVHDHLFAEASIKADPRFCLVVDECWLSEEAKSTINTGRKSVLIKQGCPTDLSVDILSKSHCGHFNPEVDHYRMRFSFQLSEEMLEQEQLHLHCQLTSCAMRDARQLNAKQCIISENFCLKQSLRPYLDSLRGKQFKMLVQGPIKVIPKPRIEKGKDLLSLVSPSPDSFVVDYSFDKLTNKSPVAQELVFVGLSTEAVVGIAFASFIIGAGLMATLWLIHMYTEPSRHTKQARKAISNRCGSQANFDNPEDKAASCALKPPTST